jgi:hypothetical protein
MFRVREALFQYIYFEHHMKLGDFPAFVLQTLTEA